MAFYIVPNIVYHGTATGSPWRARSVNGYVDEYLVYSDATKTNLLACSSAAEGEIIIPSSVTSFGERAFQKCTGLTSITIPSSVTSIGDYAFLGCTGLTSITIPNSVTSIGEWAFVECPKLTAIYVPCGEIERFRQMLGYDSRVQYNPLPYTLTVTSVNGRINYPTTICEDKILTAIPNRTYYFVQWSDGVKDNPRSFDLTQDTTFEAIFDYLLTDRCGKENVLTWTLDTATLALNITGKGELSDNYTYGSFIKSVTIGNDVSLIGKSAFQDCKDLKNIIIGSSVKVLEEGAFHGCSSIETIICYSQRPPTVNNAFSNLPYSTIIYVPADYLNTYKMHDAWGLYDVRTLGATTTETTDIKVTPNEYSVDVVWPAIEEAATYELVVKDKSGNTICTLIFNAAGQLTQIAFNAPSRKHVPQQTQSKGFVFTVTGLDSGTAYDLTMTAKDSNGSTLDANTISFTTSGDEQSLDQITNYQLPMTNKIIKDNQLLILRGDKTYSIDGRQIK